MREFVVAVVGASGAVGEEIVEIFKEIEFPLKKLVLLSSSKSAGTAVEFNSQEIVLQELTHEIFAEEGIEIALFSAGGSISKEFAQSAVKAGAVVIDNTSFFRMDDDVPLVVPEVNPEDITKCANRGIIANPNCSTIQMVQVLKPLDNAFDLIRVDVSTYQATSGAGKEAMKELVEQMQDFFAFKLDDSKREVFTHQIALNVIPQIDLFMENGYTKEEIKMVNETKKILHKDVEVSATCVRVPVLRGHSESITLTFDSEVDAGEARDILRNSPNIIVQDDIENSYYPMPITSVEQNSTFVGRIRRDLYRKNVLHLWVVADNLRVGAATNAVRIAQKWAQMVDS